MDLLDFARGPALQIAIAIFVFGVVARLVTLFLLPRARDLTPARKGALPGFLAALREIIRRVWPDITPSAGNMFTTVNGYIFHLGLAIIVFGFAPHIQFLNSLFGVSWPALPSALIDAVSIITLVSLLAALIKRLISPVLRLISRWDDYLTWLFTTAPVVTGLVAVSHLGARYETLLAIHILSVAAMLIWFPFGKLMHAFLVFISRGTIGVYLNHRGAQL